MTEITWPAKPKILPGLLRKCLLSWEKGQPWGQRLINTIVTESEGPAALCSEANEEARLVERKVCFISEACNPEGGVDSCPKADSHPLTTSGQELL